MEAQDMGLYVEIDDNDKVSLKEEGRLDWINKPKGHLPVYVRDSLWVKHGSVQLCVAGGKCKLREKGKYRIEQPKPEGILKKTTKQLGRLLAIVIPNPKQDAAPFVARGGLDTISLSPILLFPKGKEIGKVSPNDFQFIWLPALSNSLQKDAGTTRVRFYRSEQGCKKGILLLDTLAEANRINISNKNILQNGEMYRVELTTNDGEDTACFVVASKEEVVSLQNQVKEVLRALETEGSPSSINITKRTLALVGLMLSEGFYYDALVTLDELRQQFPNDSYLEMLWERILIEGQALSTK